jgi:hypothetical protein
MSILSALAPLLAANNSNPQSSASTGAPSPSQPSGGPSSTASFSPYALLRLPDPNPKANGPTASNSTTPAGASSQTGASTKSIDKAVNQNGTAANSDAWTMAGPVASIPTALLRLLSTLPPKPALSETGSGNPFADSLYNQANAMRTQADAAFADQQRVQQQISTTPTPQMRPPSMNLPAALLTLLGAGLSQNRFNNDTNRFMTGVTSSIESRNQADFQNQELQRQSKLQALAGNLQLSKDQTDRLYQSAQELQQQGTSAYLMQGRNNPTGRLTPAQLAAQQGADSALSQSIGQQEAHFSKVLADQGSTEAEKQGAYLQLQKMRPGVWDPGKGGMDEDTARSWARSQSAFSVLDGAGRGYLTNGDRQLKNQMDDHLNNLKSKWQLSDERANQLQKLQDAMRQTLPEPVARGWAEIDGINNLMGNRGYADQITMGNQHLKMTDVSRGFVDDAAKALSSQIGGLQGNIGSLNKQLGAAKSDDERASINRRIQQMRSQIGALQGQYNDVKSQGLTAVNNARQWLQDHAAARGQGAGLFGINPNNAEEAALIQQVGTALHPYLGTPREAAATAMARNVLSARIRAMRSQRPNAQQP